MAITDWSNLLQGAKRGDDQAFAVIYAELAKPVFRFVFSRTKDESLAEDITQETMVRLYQHLDQLAESEHSVLPWCYTVAKRLMIDNFRRKHSTDVSLEELLEVGSGEKPEEAANLRHQFAQLTTELENLSTDEHQAIWLKYIDGLSNEEIATALAKTEVAVRKLQSRGLAKLRLVLKP